MHLKLHFTCIISSSIIMARSGPLSTITTLLLDLALAVATLAYHTATTTTTVEIMTPREQSQCRQQMQGQRLSSCRRYLRYSTRFSEEADDWREEFPRCCEALEQISEPCRCQAIKQVVQQQPRAGLQGREMREMLQTAQSLPSLCRIPPRYCQNIRSTMF